MWLFILVSICSLPLCSVTLDTSAWPHLVPLEGAAGRDEDRGGEGEVAHTLQRPVHQTRVQPANLGTMFSVFCQIDLPIM